jgi:hypothetical protein
MRIHANPINLNAQLDALSASQRAEGKKEAARTRKKLSEFASALAGEGESGEARVVSLEGSEDPQERAKGQDRPGSAEKQKEESDPKERAKAISDWA